MDTKRGCVGMGACMCVPLTRFYFVCTANDFLGVFDNYLTFFKLSSSLLGLLFFSCFLHVLHASVFLIFSGSCE